MTNYLGSELPSYLGRYWDCSLAGTFAFRDPLRVTILSHKALDGVGVVVVDGVSLLCCVEAIVGGFSMVGAGLPKDLGH